MVSMNFILDAITMHVRLFIWLNPEPPALWHCDSHMPKYAPLHSNVLKVSNSPYAKRPEGSRKSGVFFIQTSGRRVTSDF